MADFEALKDQWSDVEDRDGIRLSLEHEASRLVVPIGALYTPLKEKTDTPLLQYQPVVGRPPCKGVLNPFCQVDRARPCLDMPLLLEQGTQLPVHYKDILSRTDPSRAAPKHSTTIEYRLPTRPRASPPLFLNTIIMSLSLLPSYALVGLITYGTMTASARARLC
ncbi:hypothetical protein DE146DRAFT_761782 [Phaeosphaeria sp. MPI-PUGE-AT-0046c]|nr:hypothetical protein DE146DRAFT_761782 [Phaeosphaeria sp. MPI-PUGE-AT-0046c]